MSGLCWIIPIQRGQLTMDGAHLIVEITGAHAIDVRWAGCEDGRLPVIEPAVACQLALAIMEASRVAAQRRRR
jgi:hypothetical protein